MHGKLCQDQREIQWSFLNGSTRSRMQLIIVLISINQGSWLEGSWRKSGL